ncbi:MAG: hypothetical protein ACFE85_12500 [Candidatus Hodarchaeota archaeon]
MKEISSYFDWEANFKPKLKRNENDIKERKLMNSLGISNLLFKQYLKIWKERNQIPDLK